MIDVLLTLASGEKHGYAIMSELEAIGGRTSNIGPATLYRSLASLLGAGLIEESQARPGPTDDDGRRRYYRLTTKGAVVASEEADRMEALLASARRSGPLSRKRSPGLAGVE